MKHTIKLLKAALLIAMVSCLESEDLVTSNAKTGGLLDPTSTSVNYVVGNPGPYQYEFLVKQGTVPTDEIRIYKSFVHSEKFTVMENGKEVEKDTTFTSNEILDRTISVSETTNHFLTTTYTFAELIAGLEIASLTAPAAPLSTSDGDYSIGDQWVFRVESALSDGRVVQQGYTISTAVSTRFAGKYKVVDATYYRVGVFYYDENDWGDNGTITIASVDGITYKQVEYWGPFDGNTLYFQVDPATLEIDYPAEWDGVAQQGNDNPLITCITNPADMMNSNCGSSNIAILDDVNGKDRLIMSFGYYTAGSGPREFYQVLEKIVE